MHHHYVEELCQRFYSDGFLEFHHVKAFAKDGPTTSVNLTLRCRAHNAHEARLEFGDLITPPMA